MRYNILRGRNTIGANLIEITHESTRILIEFGKDLQAETEVLSELEKQVIITKYDACLISHYHGDHAGLIGELNTSVYMGEGCKRIMETMSNYLKLPLPKDIKTYTAGKSFWIGKIKITPYLCDHSALDSHMLLFEGGGERILYTGDFRSGGRKSFEKLLSHLPQNIDTLIYEGTNLGDGRLPFIKTEAELESKAVKIMKSNNKPVFILQSSANFDSLVSFYRAAKRTEHRFYIDDFQSQMTFAAGGKIPNPNSFNDVFAFASRLLKGKRYEKFKVIKNRKSATQIAKDSSAVILIRQSMLPFLHRLDRKQSLKGATMIYSLWEGYKNKSDMSEFLQAVSDMGVNTVSLHTSGHADRQAIEILKQTVNAKEEVIVHTQNFLT